MLSHFSKNNFYDFVTPAFGFNGKMVMENVKKEWKINNILLSDEPSFETEKTEAVGSNELLNIVEKLPFSLSTLQQTLSTEENAVQKSAHFFRRNDYVTMKKVSFCYPSNSTQYFHKQQRDRRIWWRKLSALPSRFQTTEIINEENGNMAVDITAEFEWGVEPIEKIYCDTVSPHLLVKDGRKSTAAHTITSECKLEVATLVYLCDAFDQMEDSGVMRFHRKMSPFNITFAISAASSTVTKDLLDLALVLARKIRKIGVSCLLLPDVSRRSLESTFSRADAFGIPYTIVLNERTLVDGIIAIRSRDTTLKEQSHIGIVVSYIEQLMKNY